MDFDRRRFLRGKIGDGALPLYPPWAGRRQVFESRCTRCHDCINACPEALLRISETGLPVADFRVGECTFCGKCAAACPEKAIDPVENQITWTYRARVGAQCLAKRHIMCDSCRDSCPESAISMKPVIGGPATPSVDETCCSGCGACVRTCPAGAIQIL